MPLLLILTPKHVLFLRTMFLFFYRQEGFVLTPKTRLLCLQKSVFMLMSPSLVWLTPQRPFNLPKDDIQITIPHDGEK